jgi:hypothetical protein
MTTINIDTGGTRWGTAHTGDFIVAGTAKVNLDATSKTGALTAG